MSSVSQAQKENSVSDRIIKHLASHLEAIAVKALPWHDEANDRSEHGSRTDRSGTVSVDNSSRSRTLSSNNSICLHFAEESSNDLSCEHMPITNETISSPVDLSYEDSWGFIERPPYFGHDRDEILQPLLQRLFLEDAASNVFSGLTLPAYLVPVTRNENFHGRDYALKTLQQMLCMSSRNGLEFQVNKPLSWPRSCAVYGPGGVGKTEVAAQFVSEHRDKFDAVLWVHAEDPGKIAHGYKDLAIGLGLVAADSRSAMDLDYTKDVLKRWLVNPQKARSQDDQKGPEKASWLLVFDDVEDGEVLNTFWPYNGPGSILITSRNPYSWPASLELKPFNISEATSYLFHMTDRKPFEGEEMEAATTFANRLGRLPLALSLVGSIVASKNISFANYLQSFEEHGRSQAFYDWRFPDKLRSTSTSESNVESVWAFDRLGKGAALINVISFLDPDAIPEFIFTSPVSEDDSEVVNLIKTDFRTARTELLARSLIAYNKGQRRLSVHRLIQEDARARILQSDMRRYFLACVELINNRWAFQEMTWRHSVARWADCEELFPHVQRLKNMFPSITPSPDSFEDYEFARLLIDSGWYQHERGQSPDAVLSNNMAQSICESLKLRLLEHPELAHNSPVTLSKLNHSLLEIAHNRGCIALEINEPIDALKYLTMFNKNMIRERSEDCAEDMRLAISWNGLGTAHMLNRNWKKGEECFLKSIEEMRKHAKFRATTISLPVSETLYSI
jgi:hypothetical protein